MSFHMEGETDAVREEDGVRLPEREAVVEIEGEKVELGL